jgi:phosphopantothenoylcysteine decarboxylase/phosphopantothenate--cysteine ligase
MTDLAGKRIVLGLSGGIACYKSAELVRGLVGLGARVDVIMTESATRFITPVTLQALSGRPVFTDMWDARVNNNMAHIDLTRDADLIVVAPASANFMARLAHGLADDLLSTLCLARNIPLFIAPAMNREMWESHATQRNVKLIQSDGVILMGPDAGEQACGEVGLGRMREPPALLADIVQHFKQTRPLPSLQIYSQDGLKVQVLGDPSLETQHSVNKRLAGKRVLITAGPTYEPIDPVRGITNRSSGKTGYAIAQAAFEAGAQVVLVSGPTHLVCPVGVERIDVITAQEMYDAVVPVAAQFDIFIAVAAVADWRVAESSAEKIKKSNGHPPTLTFVPNPDILATVAALPQAPWCVGFAAETHLLSQHAKQKRLAKKVPLLIANLAQDVMHADHTQVTLFDNEGEQALAPGLKLDVAHQIIHAIADRMSEPFST